MLELTEGDRAELTAILERIVPGSTVVAFGSRVTGGARRFSDLDLCIRGPQRMTLDVRADLRAAFEESDLPFRVDFHDWHDADETFRDIVERQGGAHLSRHERRVLKPRLLADDADLHAQAERRLAGVPRLHDR